MKKVLLFTLILCVSSVYAQKIDFSALENKIERHILRLEYAQAQNELLHILKTQSLTDRDRTKIEMMLAGTYRSIDDYHTCISYLNTAQKTASSLPENDSLHYMIKAKLALAYFDSNQYEQSDQLMKLLNQNQYKNLPLRDKAYIIMQEAYLLQLASQFSEAQKKYLQSVKIMNSAAPCHSPVVKVKEMQLLGQMGQLGEAEKLYQRIIDKADSCKIIKYKVYATEELKRIFERHNQLEKSGFYSKKLEEYEYQFQREEKLSQLHADNNKFLTEETENEKTKSLWTIIAYIITSILLLAMVYYFFFKSRKGKKEKMALESELSRMKEELNEYMITNKEQSPTKDFSDIPNIERLTPRQRELLDYMTDGYTNKEIGEKLFISESTVKYHISKIYELLELKNRKEFIKNFSKNS